MGVVKDFFLLPVTSLVSDPKRRAMDAEEDRRIKDLSYAATACLTAMRVKTGTRQQIRTLQQAIVEVVGIFIVKRDKGQAGLDMWRKMHEAETFPTPLRRKIKSVYVAMARMGALTASTASAPAVSAAAAATVKGASKEDKEELKAAKLALRTMESKFQSVVQSAASATDLGKLKTKIAETKK
jgi:hypothetical protein